MKYIMTCAGTAGHINPAIAIADSLRQADPKAEFLFIGSGREMENRLIPMAGYKICNIKASGLSRGTGLKKLISHARTAADLAAGSLQAAACIRRFKPDAVIGTGGYVCFPVIKCAHMQKIPCFIHESNAVPGLTTRLLGRTADTIFVAFPGMEKEYACPERVVFTGTPVRGGFSALSREEARNQLGLKDEKLVVSFWGSLGAETCNRSSAEAIILNEANPCYRQIHATGGGDAGWHSFMDSLEAHGLPADKLKVTDVRPYIDNMPVVMTAADLILCRSGASTMGELTAIGRPAVLVPSPYVTDNHQEKNALRLTQTGGAVMIKEQSCSGKELHDTVTELLRSPERLRQMEQNIRSVGVPDSAERIAEYILSHMHAGNGENAYGS